MRIVYFFKHGLYRFRRTVKTDVPDFIKDIRYDIKKGNGIRKGLGFAMFHYKAKHVVSRYWRMVAQELFESVSCEEEFNSYQDYISKYWDAKCQDLADEIKLMDKHNPDELVRAALCHQLNTNE